MNRLVVFDLDGTLVDSAQDLTNAVNAALAALGLPARRLDEVRHFVGDGVQKLMARALGEAHRHRLDEALTHYRAHYAAHLADHTRPYPGIAALVADLSMPLAIATNKPHAYTLRLLDACGWKERFACVLGGDSLPVQKPDAGILTEVCTRIGVAPTDTLMVGDGPQDLGAARAAGTRFCGVTWGFRPDELREAMTPELAKTADLADTAAELRAVIRR